MTLRRILPGPRAHPSRCAVASQPAPKSLRPILTGPKYRLTSSCGIMYEPSMVSKKGIPMQAAKIRTVVLVDDDAANARYDEEALANKGYNVIYFVSVSKCAKRLRSLLRKADLFVIDVLFKDEPATHPCSRYPNSAAGLWLAGTIRHYKPDMPIILFSSDRSELIFPHANRVAADLSIESRRNCVFLEKNKYLPPKLAKLVERYFKRGVFEVTPMERAGRLLDEALTLVERLKLLPFFGKSKPHG
jgi:CheY-like chemotaxis protein